jgi:hypothetical protein
MSAAYNWSAQEIADKKKAFLQALDDGCINMLDASEKSGVPYFTALLWTKKDEEFAQAWETARETSRERRIDFAECMLHKNIGESDNTSIIFFLKTIGRTRGFQDRMQIDQNVTHTLDLEEGARRIAFAMNAARAGGQVIEGNITDILPAIEHEQPTIAETRKQTRAVVKTMKDNKAVKLKKHKAKLARKAAMLPA